MITIREETFHDVEAREALLDACFGPARFQKTCERLREGRMPADGLSLVIDRNSEIIGTVRLWHVSAGPNRPALMLGPIAIDPSVQSLGLGGKLMREALKRAAGLGHKAVLLVGDAPYYERFGFSPGRPARSGCRALRARPLPRHGPEAGALGGASGLVSATGAFEQKPDLGALVAAAAQGCAGLAFARLCTILYPFRGLQPCGPRIGQSDEGDGGGRQHVDDEAQGRCASRLMPRVEEQQAGSADGKVAADATTMMAPASARILPRCVVPSGQLSENRCDHHVGAARCQADQREEIPKNTSGRNGASKVPRAMEAVMPAR